MAVWSKTASIKGPTGGTGTAGAKGNGTPLLWGYKGTLATVAAAQRIYVEAAGALASIRASVNAAPAGSAITVDVLKNGVSILGGTPITIAAGAFVVLVNNTTAFVAGDYFQVAITAVGSTTAGSDLTVQLNQA